MARTELKKVLEQASALAGQQITVCGWVKTIRDSKALGFIELNDGSSFSNLQVVFEDAKVPSSSGNRHADADAKRQTTL